MYVFEGASDHNSYAVMCGTWCVTRVVTVEFNVFLVWWYASVIEENNVRIDVTDGF